MKSKTKKKSIGRPRVMLVDVLPENWKELVFEWSCLGWSEAMIRTALSKNKAGKISNDLWYALQEREAEFSETIQRCKVYRQGWWEQQVLENLKSPNFQTGAWYACMKNMFGWRDKTDVVHAGDIVHHYEVKKVDLEERGEIIKACDLKASAN